MQYTEEAKIEIKTWYRESTHEWVADIEYKANGTSGSTRCPAYTKEEARNAAFASIGHLLMLTTYED